MHFYRIFRQFAREMGDILQNIHHMEPFRIFFGKYNVFLHYMRQLQHLRVPQQPGRS